MVVFDPYLFPQVAALRQIHSATSKTVRFLNGLNFPPTTPDSLPVLQPAQAALALLDLPLTEEVLTPILKLIESDSLRTAVRDCFTNRFTEMQRRYTANYQRTCAFLLQTGQPASAHRSLQGAYLNSYRSQCHALVEKQLPYVMKEVAKLKRSGLRQDTTRIEFNHEYTPILESYFAYNAYPSLPDRLLLARKSMMTPRQIEVWFQNHRNRAKKEGVTLRRIPPSTASAFALDQPAPYIQLVNANRSRSATVDIESSDDDSSSQHCEDIVFADHRPLHAFPTPYSANSGSDSFSRNNQIFKLASQNWMRSPATHAPQRSSMSVSDLAKLLAQLSIRDRASSSRGSKSVIKQRKWASPLLVAPFTAPHPAVVNPNYVLRPSTIQTSSSCSWQQPSLGARKVMPLRTHVSYPSWAVYDTRRQRKAPHSNRRLPSSPPNAHLFHATPRISSTSSSASSSSSSSSSIFSTGSRSSSTSSLSSEATVELHDTLPGSLMASINNDMDLTLADTQHEPNSSNDLQSLSSSLLQNQFTDMSQDWTFPISITMDVPGFSFFES